MFVCRFCVGDRFYLCDNKILCEYDYEERLVFANMASMTSSTSTATTNGPSTTSLKRSTAPSSPQVHQIQVCNQQSIKQAVPPSQAYLTYLNRRSHCCRTRDLVRRPSPRRQSTATSLSMRIHLLHHCCSNNTTSSRQWLSWAGDPSDGKVVARDKTTSLFLQRIFLRPKATRHWLGPEDTPVTSASAVLAKTESTFLLKTWAWLR